MGRLPFDPEKMRIKRSRDDRPLSVAELAARIDGTLKRGMGEPVRVAGEISGFRDRTHWYFDLKDEAAVVSCVVFASAARRLAIRPQDGQEVVVRGRIEYWAKGGKLSLLCDAMDPVGEGALDLAFRKLCEELRELGWFETGRKRPIPAVPRRIAVVTSETGAALQDVLDTARKRGAAADIDLVDVRVQGRTAAPEIARAISILAEHAPKLGIDAIVLTRGGGSKEDLWAFNERIVARAIHDCPIPIVAAIGHESDTTIAELVADLRCATPTQAAMAVFPDREDLSRQIDSLRRRLCADVRRRMETARRRIEAAERRPWLRDPRRLLDPLTERVAGRHRTLRREMILRLRDARSAIDRLAVRLDAHRPAVVHARLTARLEARRASLESAMRERLGESRWRVQAGGRELEAIAPQRVLNRGYSWTTTADGALLRSASSAVPGDLIRTHLADGEIDSTVVGQTPAGPTPERSRIGKEPPPQKPSRTTPTPKAESGPADQMDLF